MTLERKGRTTEQDVQFEQLECTLQREAWKQHSKGWGKHICVQTKQSHDYSGTSQFSEKPFSNRGSRKGLCFDKAEREPFPSTAG